MTSTNYPKEIETLPITPFLDQICENLANSPSHFLVLSAQTAAGKSTALPLALLQHFPDTILMLEPRRLATVAIASRVAQLLNEEVGDTAGFRLHLESKISSKTRLEVITEAILTRRLQQDPSLEGVSVVILDEFHERSVHGDLALAFLKEAMALRDDLFVLVMSATMNTKKLSAYLDDAPVMDIPGRLFPVEIEYKDSLSPAQAAIRELERPVPKESPFPNPSILVFLPGISEIRRVKSQLEEKLSSEEAEILILHSSIPLKEQKKVLSPPEEGLRRIILSSSIAETSLTVPAVTTVIDSGLCRINKMDVALGMEKLVTQRESLFSARQRSGRAGRLCAGRAIRLWNQHEILQESQEPELLRSDLLPIVLECAQWGALSPDKILWLDKPSRAAWITSCTLLEELGFIARDKITEKGKAALRLGVGPRLAATVLRGLETGQLDLAIETVLAFSSYAQSNPQQQKLFCQDLKRRVQNLPNVKEGQIASTSPALLLLEGFPDRIAVKAEETGDYATYQFPSGRKARLSGAKGYPKYLVAPEVNAGTSTGTIYSYQSLDEDQALKWLEKRARTYTQTSFADTPSKGHFRLTKSEYTAFGSIILKEKKLNTSPEDFAAAVEHQIQKEGLSFLPLSDASKNLLIRTLFFIHQAPESDSTRTIIDTNYRSLVTSPSIWLTPFLPDAKSLTESTVYNALHWFLQGDVIDQNVPLEIKLPNGRKRKLSYEIQGQTNGSLLNPLPEECPKITPILEVIIQQIFGCFETPKIMGVPILLKLLSPARRPLQITEDLAGFWTGSWLDICKEMKGRYPKHNWDYRIAEKD